MPQNINLAITFLYFFIIPSKAKITGTHKIIRQCYNNNVVVGTDLTMIYSEVINLKHLWIIAIND